MAEHASTTDEAAVFRLIYRSRDRIAPEQRRAELGRLFTVARSKNKKRNVTGALLMSDEFFVQTLEGDEPAVRELFATIEKDPRHDEVAIIQAVRVEARAFPRWAMAQVTEGTAQHQTYLIAHEDGVAPAADRGTTAPQEAVLGTMRNSMYGSPSRR